MTRGQISILSCLAVFLFLSLGQFFFSIGGTFYDSQRIAQSMLLVLLGILSLQNRRYINTLFSNRYSLLAKVALLSVLFCVLGVFSALFSTDALNSLMYVALYVLLFFLLISIACLFTDKFATDVLYLFVLFHSGVVLYSSLFLVFALIQGDTVRPSIIYFGFDNIRFFNQAQIFVLPLLLYLISIKRVSIVAQLFMFLNLVLMFVGGGFGVSLSWLCICLLLMAFDKRLFIRAILQTAVAFLFASIVLNGFEFTHDSSSAVIVLSDGGRLPIWLSLLAQLDWKHLLVGIGPGLYVDMSGFSTVSHPHNFLLELLYEWGGLALTIALALVMLTIRDYVRNVYSTGAFRVGDAFFLSWLGGLLYSLVSGVLVMPVPQTLIFITWGVLVGYIHRAPRVIQDFSVSPSSISSSLIVAFIFMLSLVYGGMVLFSVFHMSAFDVSIQGPRFWLNGLRYL